MTPEEKSLLERTYELAKENNEMLVGLRRRARLGLAWKITYWVLIIAVSFGALYFIQPYVDMIKALTGHGNSTTSTTEKSSYADQIRDLLN